MQVYIRCLYTSYHNLYLTFDHEGVCSGCVGFTKKKTSLTGQREHRSCGLFLRAITIFLLNGT
jgi:hypothetical protein